MVWAIFLSGEFFYSPLLLFPYYYFIALLSFYFCIITLFLYYRFISMNYYSISVLLFLPVSHIYNRLYIFILYVLYYTFDLIFSP